MCKIKSGKNVQTRRDLQNLVTSVILQQENGFNETQLFKAIQTKLKDSRYYNEDREVSDLISHTCNVLGNNDCISYRNGTYYINDLCSV